MQNFNLPEHRREVRGLSSWWKRHADWLSCFSVPGQIAILVGEVVALLALVSIGLGLGIGIGLLFD